MKMTRTEVADKIDAFVNGKGGKWDWDDFVAIRLSDPELDAIRQKCVSVREEYPPTTPGDYCSPAGMEALRGILSELRAHVA
jgi:hypothetical protein